MVSVEVYKDLVIAWLILKRKWMHKKGFYIDALPVVIDWNGTDVCFYYREEEDGLSCVDDFPDDAEVLAVIPAQPETYLVYAWVDNKPVVLGIEAKGSSHPDWVQKALEKLGYIKRKR